MCEAKQREKSSYQPIEQPPLSPFPARLQLLPPQPHWHSLTVKEEYLSVGTCWSSVPTSHQANPTLHCSRASLGFRETLDDPILDCSLHSRLIKIRKRRSTRRDLIDFIQIIHHCLCSSPPQSPLPLSPLLLPHRIPSSSSNQRRLIGSRRNRALPLQSQGRGDRKSHSSSDRQTERRKEEWP